MSEVVEKINEGNKQQQLQLQQLFNQQASANWNTGIRY